MYLFLAKNTSILFPGCVKFLGNIPGVWPGTESVVIIDWSSLVDSTLHARYARQEYVRSVRGGVDPVPVYGHPGDSNPQNLGQLDK
jgi:hypothetical protein